MDSCSAAVVAAVVAAEAVATKTRMGFPQPGFAVFHLVLRISWWSVGAVTSQETRKDSKLAAVVVLEALRRPAMQRGLWTRWLPFHRSLKPLCWPVGFARPTLRTAILQQSASRLPLHQTTCQLVKEPKPCFRISYRRA
jgi:hypothetical protein